MKLLAFGASYSKDSINKKFAVYVAKQFPDADVEILDLRDYQLPLYTTESEAEIGFPHAVLDFIAKLEGADMIVVSLAEHNGSYTTAFKNLFDWASRVKLKIFDGKKLLLLATAPGPRGGLSVLQVAADRFPIHGAEIAGAFSLPRFHDNFSEEAGILDETLRQAFNQMIDTIRRNQHDEYYADIP